MSSERRSGRRIETRVLDVLGAIADIREFVAGYDRERFLKDQKTQAAVERQLQIIAEACTQLRHLEVSSGITEREQLEQRFPNIEWAQIRGFGNRLHHEYGTIDPAVIWDLAIRSRRLDDLKDALMQAFPGLTA